MFCPTKIEELERSVSLSAHEDPVLAVVRSVFAQIL